MLKCIHLTHEPNESAREPNEPSRAEPNFTTTKMILENTRKWSSKTDTKSVHLC